MWMIIMQTVSSLRAHRNVFIVIQQNDNNKTINDSTKHSNNLFYTDSMQVYMLTNARKL